uniref:Uncharacterized protein LOC114328444 n=1 Tax=Diabrotica virgifera virgifera TaxID=50390 RepID=A0A6P7FBV9_DIAVI
MSALKYHKSNRYCSVPQCQSRSSEDISLFLFPKLKKLQKRWTDVLKIGKKVSPYMYVCSLHFLSSDLILPDVPTKRKRLKKNAIPSQNLPQSSVITKTNNPALAQIRMDRIQRRNMQREIMLESSARNHPSTSTMVPEPEQIPIELEEVDTKIIDADVADVDCNV